ncbi:MAG: type II toxin-antitoxin system RelE/ParE family toxin [Tepidisphaeraceae bacterium]|jgi:mRNA interferase RelE/StbE
MYSVVLSPGAQRFFEEADAPLQRRLDRCFVNLAREPRRHGNIKQLKGSLQGYLRYRVGDWRIIDRIDDTSRTIFITDIAH